MKFGNFSSKAKEVKLIDPASLGKISEELVNWNGHRLPIISAFGKYWVVKVMAEREVSRELLVFKLSKSLCNTPEVRIINKRTLEALHLLGIAENGNTKTTILIELAQTIPTSRLPNKDLDNATAAELMFSLWVRRRDADSWNRSYNSDGVPIFYDLSASLDFEDDLIRPEDFFSYNRYGYAGSWRVKIMNENTKLSASKLRRNKDHFNYIVDKNNFLESLERVKNTIKRRAPRLVKQASRYSDNAKELLLFTTKNLDDDAKILKQVIFSEIQPDLERRSQI